MKTKELDFDKPTVQFWITWRNGNTAVSQYLNVIDNGFVAQQVKNYIEKTWGLDDGDSWFFKWVVS